MNVGILLPRSTTHPLIAFDLMAGLSAALNFHALSSEIKLHTTSIGFGTDAELILKEAENLFMHQQVDVLIAFADEPKVEGLYPLVTALKKQLLVINHGAKFNAVQISEYVSFHSLNGTISAYLTAQLAKSKYDQAIVASSFFDGGFSLSQAMVDSFIQAEDSFVHFFIGGRQLEPFDTVELQAVILKQEIPVPLLSILSGAHVADFFNQLSVLPGDKKPEIYASSVLIDEALTMEDQPGFAVKGYTTWYRESESVENKQYVTAFEKATKRPANAIGVLGWDTGLILKAILENDAESNQVYTAFNIEGAKGKLSFHAESKQFLSTQYLAEKTAESAFEFQATNEEQAVLALENITHQYPKGSNVGWLNTYLCS